MTMMVLEIVGIVFGGVFALLVILLLVFVGVSVLHFFGTMEKAAEVIIKKFGDEDDVEVVEEEEKP